MPDYPDWQRAYRLVGTEIVLDINIDAVAVTLPVSIEAATATVSVEITGAVQIDVNIAAAAVALDVDIVAQTIGNITFEFADQSVAVFDAAKWFAKQGSQIIITGALAIAASATSTVVSRVVPTGKTFYLCGIAYGVEAAYAVSALFAGGYLDSTVWLRVSSERGEAIIFDTPLKVAAGENINIRLVNQDAAQRTFYADMWGYDETT